MLDIAIRPINEHTSLQIDCRLQKKGRAFTRARFGVRKQPLQQLPLIFADTQADTRTQLARRPLDTHGIAQIERGQQIPAEPKLVDELCKFRYKLETDSVKANHNPSGLLLEVQGLR